MPLWSSVNTLNTPLYTLQRTTTTTIQHLQTRAILTECGYCVLSLLHGPHSSKPQYPIGLRAEHTETYPKKRNHPRDPCCGYNLSNISRSREIKSDCTCKQKISSLICDITYGRVLICRRFPPKSLRNNKKCIQIIYQLRGIKWIIYQSEKNIWDLLCKDQEHFRAVTHWKR